MPTLSTLTKYKELLNLRQILIEELRENEGISQLNVEVLKLIEMRVQTLLSLGILDITKIKEDFKK